MTTLVNEKFLEWTHGLDLRQSMISVFEHIRDIPYSLAVPMTDPKTSPEHMLRLGKGYCGPKHYLLAEMYRRMGVDAVYATFPFIWNDPDIRYPQELRLMATGLPVIHHLACRVRINDRWVLVDATWDLPLKQAGFPVNENWDGRADTKCAVKPLRSAVRTAFCRTATNEPCRDGHDAEFNPLDGENDYGDVEDHARFYRQKIGMRTAEDIDRIRVFYQKFDIWLETLR
ncbi:MAG: transglutaminase family protein [Methanoregula sp.]|jgi:transglutaminase-like putative cysteine protease|nr:transglutaminase family protein [Methanoregula sp.]